MSQAHSLGQKKRWGKVSRKTRSKTMSIVRRKGWAKKTKKELKAEGKRLAGTRQKKI